MLVHIERRTWLGDNFEKVMPFISAGQNAVQAVGRLTSRDPSAAALIASCGHARMLAATLLTKRQSVLRTDVASRLAKRRWLE